MTFIEHLLGLMFCSDSTSITPLQNRYQTLYYLISKMRALKHRKCINKNASSKLHEKYNNKKVNKRHGKHLWTHFGFFSSSKLLYLPSWKLLNGPFWNNLLSISIRTARLHIKFTRRTLRLSFHHQSQCSRHTRLETLGSHWSIPALPQPVS